MGQEANANYSAETGKESYPGYVADTIKHGKLLSNMGGASKNREIVSVRKARNKTSNEVKSNNVHYTQWKTSGDDGVNVG